MATLRPTWQDIITEHSVQTWQDWPWETWLGPYVVISPRRYRVRVRVYRAGEWVDITSRVASGVIRESNDQPVATLDLRLLEGGRIAPGPMTVPSLTTMRAEHEVPALPMRDAGPLPSIAPRRKDSPLNRVNGEYVPLLWIGRLIAVEAAFSEDGSEPDEWWPVFLGELEDEIDTESGPDGTYVRLFCRDMAARLQRAYIAGPWTFENMYASQMIQAILDHAYSEGLIQEPVQLRLIGPDDFWVERYDIEYTDLWSALQRFCQQRGTDLRYRLNEATGQIELTYWLPDRAMVPGWIIDASQIKREELRISGTDIINRVTVRYRDAQTGQRAEVTVQDEDSIAMYGLRHGLIEEPDTDLIPDAATAQKLAQTIVEDLKDVPALTRITCPFDPRIQLFDKLRVANPNVRDESEDYAIEGRELQFSATDWSMVLVGGGRVVVKRQAWLERMATEGVKRPFTPRDTTTSVIPPAPTIIEAKSVPGGVQLTLAPPLGLYWNGFIIHASTTPNFTPSGATEVAWGSETRFSILGLQPGTTYYFKAQAMDFARNRSAASNEVSAKAGALTPDGFTAVVGNALVTTDGGGAERVAVGDISGRPWGSGVLAHGTYGLWGELAGLYLRGYTRLLMVASGLDEEIVDLSGFPNLANPAVIVLPKELVSYSPERATLSHLYVDAVRLDSTRWRLKAKTMVKGQTIDWGSRANQRNYWEHVRPIDADPINGRKGVWTNFLICRPRWWVSGAGGGLYTARLWMDITNEFNANGDPINWQTIRTFSRSSGGEGTLNWDTSVPYGQWAMRVRGQGDGSLVVSYAETGLAASGYRTGDTYLRVDGSVITDPDPGNVPSGMSVVYFAVDQG